jgi:Mrp family chromosome partitioning ATPase
MLGQLASRNIVVIDGPPLLESSVGVVLADHVDVVLLVADLRSLTRADVAETVAVLSPLSPSVVGWVTHQETRLRRSQVFDVGA